METKEITSVFYKTVWQNQFFS